MRWGSSPRAAVAVLVNLDKWKSLDEAQRGCLNEMTLWLEGQWPAWREAENKVQMQAQEKSGIEVVQMGDAFAAQAEQAYWADLEQADPDFVGKLKPLLTDLK